MSNVIQKRTIDYTNYDFDALHDDLINQLQETEVYKDVNIKGSNINTFVDLISYVGSLFGYYINSAANEVFLPTAKRYNNLNKLGQLLKYDARGVVSSKVDVVGVLNPEYVYGKEGQYIEIPAYSLFPSTKATNDGTNFSFTNVVPVNYIVKSFGIRPLFQSDITYKGYALPFTANISFFQENGSTSNPEIRAEDLTIPLNLYKNLSIIQRNTPTKYRPFDTTEYPLANYSDSTSVGQPFNMNIDGNVYPTTLTPSVAYPVLLKFDKSISKPSLEIVTDSQTLSDRADDIIGKITLTLIDATSNTYQLSLSELSTTNRFYIGKLGLNNLESTKLQFDKMNGTQSVQRINLVINPDGNSPAFTALVNGQYYSFSSGTISSQIFSNEFFDGNVEYYNVNLVIGNQNNPNANYEAYLDVTTKEPISNQITIARIYTGYVDQNSNTSTFTSAPGKKYGNLQVVETTTYKTAEQKGGRIFFKAGDTVQNIIFNTVFVPDNSTPADYIIQLTSDNNIRTWYTNRHDTGFTINIEPDTQFEGYVSWTATKLVSTKVKSVDVTFDSPLPKSTTTDQVNSTYMVQLTPNDNVDVWYDNLTTNGFTIKTSRDFEGSVSWSVYNFFDTQSFPSDVENVYKQSGRILIPSDNTDGIQVTLDVPFNDQSYAIQLIPNANIKVFYSDKTTGTFTIKKAPGNTDPVTVDWYVDGTSSYKFQRHGEVAFSGRTTISQQIPGFFFMNVPETFDIPNLLQGTVGFSYINVNNVIDPFNNFLNLSVDPTRLYENSLAFIADNTSVSTNSIRIFVRNSSGTWDEWNQYGTGFNTSNAVGETVFTIKLNADQKIQIEFGDGINWGTPVQGKEIFILGLQSVGSGGNIGKNVISNNIIISQYILGNERTDIDFEKSLISLIGLKSKLFFEGSTPSTKIIDSEGTLLDNTKDLTVIQNQLAVGGADIETVDELRSNITNSFVRQNRNVSQEDTQRYINEVFYNYIVTNQVLTYTELAAANIIPSSELSKYWFNHIFVIALNSDGTNIINKSLRDTIVNNLNSSVFKMIGKEHEVLPATWVPIDVLIKYKKSPNANSAIIETEMRTSLINYFNVTNRKLGDKLYHSDFITMTKIDGVDEVEVMINKDPSNSFNANDYTVTIQNVQDPVATQRDKLMELVRKDPSLVKIFQPLFSTIDNNGVKTWNYSLDITLSAFEFPKLGDIIIERV